MSGTVDNRVVQMGFDNAQFERGVKTSLGTIQDLKKGLNFGDSIKSLLGLTNAGKNFTLGGISEGVQTVANRFSALGIVGMTALMNITNAAINAGTAIIKALTVDPVMAGMREYETKLNSIQTIMSNTQKENTTLDQVTSALDKLNEYSDKTIYNFAQMTRNVGTFTAAGVKLDASVSAIKGIANLAAVSGSNADQASTAMYQLSQALSSGTVRLMDWNSVVNAGMGGMVFQDALTETARIHGVAIDQMLKDEGSFRNTLEKGWLTSEILTETLSKFTGDLNADQLRSMGYTEDQIAANIKLGKMASDAATKVKTFTQLFDTLKEAAQSGWAKTWEIIIGDFDEAKLLMTEINDIIGAIIGSSADARNSMLVAWKAFGGREDLIAALRNAFEGVMGIIKPLTEALREIFPPITGLQLKALTQGLEDFTKKLKMGVKPTEDLKRVFKGIFAVVDIVRMAILSLAKSLGILTGDLGPAAGSLLEFLAGIGDYLVGLRNSIKLTDAFGKGISNIGKFLGPIVSSIKDFVIMIVESFSSLGSIDTSTFAKFLDTLKVRFEPLGKMGEVVSKVIGLLGKLVTKAAPIFFKLANSIGEGLGKFMDAISKGLDNINFDNLFDAVNGGLLAAILLGLKKFLDKGTGVFTGISGILNDVRGSLEAWQTSLKANTLIKIAGALALLTISVVALSMIDSAKLTSALAAMSVMFIQLFGAFAIFDKLSNTLNVGKTGAMVIGLIGISVAMLVLATAVSKLAMLNSDELVRGIIGISAITAVIIIAAKNLSSSSPKLITAGIGLGIFALAIGLLVGSVERLGALDTDALTKGLVGVGVLVAELAIFMQTTKLSSSGIASSVGLLILAGAIVLLGFAVSKFAEMDQDAMLRGLTAVGLILAGLATFVNLTQGGVSIIGTAIGLTILSVAMLLLTKSMQDLGSMSWEEIGKGLVGMAGALLIIAGAMYLMPPTMILTAASLVVVSVALVILAEALKNMGGMSWDEIARGLAVLAGTMVILAVGLNAMTSALPGAAALLVASAALAVMAVPLKILGSMSLEEIGRSLLALAGAFVILGVAGMVLTPTIPTLLGLGAAMFLIGIAAAAIGVGVLAFSAGLAALAVSGVAGAAALVVIITSIIGLVPMIAKQLGTAIIVIAKVIGEGAPVILEAFTAILLSLIAAIVAVVPELIAGALLLVTEFLTGLASKLPEIIQAGYNIIVAFLTGIRNNIGKTTTLAIEIMVNFINAISQKLSSLIDAGHKLMISFINGLAASVKANMQPLIAAVNKLALAVIEGLVVGLIKGNGQVRQGMIDLARSALAAFKETLGIHSPSTAFEGASESIIDGAVLGVEKFGQRLYSSVKGLADGAVSQFSDVTSKIADAFSSNADVNPTITPVIDMTNVMSASSRINGLFGKTSLNAGVSLSQSQAINSSLKNSGESGKEASTDVTKTDPTAISFTQNNYSPKAIERIEIYRETKNQLLQLKGMVGAK